MTNEKHKINYNRKTRTFSVLWKDYEKEALQDKYPYSRKSKKWSGDKAPNAAERRIIESELNERTKQVFNQQTGQAETVTYPFYTFSFHINRQALITSIYKRELCQKGYTWIDDEQVKIELGRKGNKFSVIDEKGERDDFDSIKDFVNHFFNNENCVRGLRKALKNRIDNHFTFKNRHFWLV